LSLKEFFYFQRLEKVAVILILILIVLVLILNCLFSYNNPEEIIIVQNDSLVSEFKDYQAFISEKERTESVSNINHGQRNTYKNYGNNRYTKNNRYSNDTTAFKERSFNKYPVQPKLSEGETITLSQSDTAQWKMIPGIGSSFARRIVKYQNLLGGFVSKEQLREVYGMDDELYTRIEPYIKEDAQVTKLTVNKLEFRDLLRFPYLSYEQVKAITDLRKRKGSISSLDELGMLEEFSQEDLLKLAPYLEF